LTKVDIQHGVNEETTTMESNGIAWMIAGGVRAESAEDRRQRRQRVELAHSAPAGSDAVDQLRQRIAAFVGSRPQQVSVDCCAA
jgi:hypothetical protein